MTESKYLREPGIDPVRIRSLRALKKRAKFGRYDEADESVLVDCFPASPLSQRRSGRDALAGR